MLFITKLVRVCVFFSNLVYKEIINVFPILLFSFRLPLDYLFSIFVSFFHLVINLCVSLFLFLLFDINIFYLLVIMLQHGA